MSKLHHCSLEIDGLWVLTSLHLTIVNSVRLYMSTLVLYNHLNLKQFLLIPALCTSFSTEVTDFLSKIFLLESSVDDVVDDDGDYDVCNEWFHVLTSASQSTYQCTFVFLTLLQLKSKFILFSETKGTSQYMFFPVPMEQPCKIWVNQPNDSFNTPSYKHNKTSTILVVLCWEIPGDNITRKRNYR